MAIDGYVQVFEAWKLQLRTVGFPLAALGFAALACGNRASERATPTPEANGAARQTQSSLAEQPVPPRRDAGAGAKVGGTKEVGLVRIVLARREASGDIKLSSIDDQGNDYGQVGIGRFGLDLPTDEICVGFSRDGRRLACLDESSDLRAWELDGARAAISVATNVLSWAWMPNATDLLITDRDGRVRIVDSAGFGARDLPIPKRALELVLPGHDESYVFRLGELEIAKVSTTGNVQETYSVYDLSMPGGALPLRGLFKVNDDGSKVLFLARANDAFRWGGSARLIASSVAFVYDFGERRSLRLSTTTLGVVNAEWLPGETGVILSAYQKTPKNRTRLDAGQHVQADLYRVELSGAAPTKIASDVWAFRAVALRDEDNPLVGSTRP